MNNQEIKPHTLASCVEQLKKCAFECEAGSLSMNTAFQWLEAAAQVCPQFIPGTGVWYEVIAEAGGLKLKQWTHFYIVGCRMESDTENRYFTYSLSYDPPAPWHYGEVHFSGVKGNLLRLENP